MSPATVRSPLPLHSESQTDTDNLGESFDAGVHAMDSSPSEDSDDEEGDDDVEYKSLASDESIRKIRETLGPEIQWIDNFIMNSRRKGGQDTEKSVLKLWSVSAFPVPC